jgi:hypothetical protein
MGSRLMPAGRDNPLGFFENLDFVEFHERWLRLNGCDRAGWLAPQSLDLPEEAYADAMELLHRNDVAEVWGWKDPRTTLFADFWSEIVPNARFIFLYREPAEVVDSLLRRRDQPVVADPELAVRSWVAHNSRILRLTRAHRSRCILANISVITRDPRRFLTIAAERLDVALNPEVTSPFEPQLMRSMEPSDQRATLLRYLVPEADRVYMDLELEADLAGGVHRDGAVSPRRARGAFFDGWLNQHAPTADNLVPSNATSVSDSVKSLDVEGSLASARAALARHQGALLKIASRIE